MFPAKEAPASTHMLVSRAELFQKKVSRSIPPGSALIRGQGNRKANEQAAGGEQAGSPGRQQQAGQAEGKAGRQANKQASRQADKQTGRQAGRQARKEAGRQAALMGRKSEAGRNVNPPFLLEGRV